MPQENQPLLKKPKIQQRFSFGTSGWRNMIRFQVGEFEDDGSKDRADSQTSLPTTAGGSFPTAATTEVRGAGSTKTFINIVKSFVGTGMLFLPEAFLKGGILFSTIALSTIALIALVTMLKLVECWEEVKGTFGEIGEAAIGKKGKIIVDTTLVIAQLSFGCVYMVFVAENIQLVILPKWEIWQLILLQIPFLTPLVWIRRVYKLSVANFIGTLFIVFSFVYIMYSYVEQIVVQKGVLPVDLINPKEFALFLGTAIFTFEGVGTVIPIQQSMKKKENFKWLLTLSIFVILGFLVLFAVMGYLTYGEGVLGPITKNLDENLVMVKIVLVLYALAIFFSYPLIIFPGVEILQKLIFDPRITEVTRTRTWKKNLFRFFVVVITAGVAIAGGDDFSKFVSLVGGFACTPLAFIYPPLFHYKLVAKSSFDKMTDIVIIVVGVAVWIFASAYSVWAWVKDSPPH